jgi:protein disulfide-isomerase-like protein
MMSKIFFGAAVALLCATGANADGPTVLTSANFDELTTNKAAFIKFFAPWCGHCKAMAPAWGQLADGFADSTTVVIGDVDCTTEKDLCSKYGVQGFPTIKYFVGSDEGEKYEGGRDFEALKAFADENLGPSCGPDNRDLCSEDQVAILDEAAALSAADLAAKIDEFKGQITAAEENFKTELDALQNKYTKLVEDKDAAIAAISPTLRLYKSVKAPAGHDEL